MKSEVLSNFNMPWLSAIGFFLFFGLFAGMLFWIFRRGSKNIYDKIEMIPLEEAEGVTKGVQR